MTTDNKHTYHYQTCIGENGETLYHAPIEIESRADLENYGITWKECRCISFGGTDRRTVYFYRTPNRELAEDQWRYLRKTHTEKVSITRCMIPGIRKTYIHCPTCNSCVRCPYGRTLPDKMLNTISLDRMMEDACAEETESFSAGNTTEDTAILNALITALESILDKEDKRLMKALKMKELLGYPIKEIADRLGCSQPRVYQLLQRTKTIAREFLAEDDDDGPVAAKQNRKEQRL